MVYTKLYGRSTEIVGEIKSLEEIRNYPSSYIMVPDYWYSGWSTVSSPEHGCLLVRSEDLSLLFVVRGTWCRTLYTVVVHTSV